jgi:uncharacterized membrane protein
MIAKILAGAFGLAFVVMVITFIYTCIVYYRRKKVEKKRKRLVVKKNLFDDRLARLCEADVEDIYS